MASGKQEPSLLVIVGPTASGKSALAMTLAKRFDGEIIAADSRTLYKGMDIGTGKPNKKERQEIPHHLIDIVQVGDLLTVADFKGLAQEAIHKVRSKGKLPILVGGSGLYIDAILFDYQFRAKADPEQRRRLNLMSVEQLQKEIYDKKLTPPLNNKNKRHLVRTIETAGQAAKRSDQLPGALVVGLNPPRSVLVKMIEARNKKMVKNGLLNEVLALRSSYPEPTALEAIGYKEWEPYIVGRATIEEVRKSITQNSINYAKRQLTWFKRNKNILWFDDVERAEQAIIQLLNT